jgi:pyruvate,water dikinase
VPDVSLGSHFFNDLVEENILYVAVFPGSPGYALDELRLRAAPNRLAALRPDDEGMASVVRVLDLSADGPGGPAAQTLWLNANCVEQEARCYFAPRPPPEEEAQEQPGTEPLTARSPR